MRPQIARELVRPVDLLGTRCDLLLREVAHRLADGVGGVAEVEVEIAGGVRDHGGPPGWRVRPLVAARWVESRAQPSTVIPGLREAENPEPMATRRQLSLAVVSGFAPAARPGMTA